MLRIPFPKDHLRQLFLLLFLLVGIAVFLPVGLHSWWRLLIKGGIFLLVFFVLYLLLFAQNSHLALSLKRSESVDKEYDGISDYRGSSEASWSGYSDAFCWYSREFTSVVRHAVAATCAAIYLKNSEGLEFLTGENEDDQFTTRKNISDVSLPGEVVRNKMPVLETHLRTGSMLNGVSGVEIRSFLGVPLVWNDEVLGVLALGSKTESGFGEEDQEFLMRFSGLFAQVMTAYFRGLRREMDNEVYKIHFDIERSLKNITDEDEAVLTFVNHLNRMFHFTRFTLCMKKGNSGIIQHVYGQIDQFERFTEFPLDEGLNGWVINHNAALVIPDIDEGEYIRPRYIQNENPKHGLHSFLAVPLGNTEKAWGCVTLESSEKNQYSEKGKEILLNLSQVLQTTIHRINLYREVQALKQNGSSIEPPGAV